MQTEARLKKRTVLLVDTRSTVLRRFGESLQRAGYEVVQAASFEDAKHLLAARTPTLVITNLRLGAFNGLHLLHLGRLADPHLEAIVLAAPADLVLKDEVDNLGALLMIEPVHTGDLIGAADRLLGVGDPSVGGIRVERRRGERRQNVVVGFTPERRIADRRAAIPVAAQAVKTIA